MIAQQTEFRWVFLPTMTYFKNRKEAKMVLGGNERFTYLLKKGFVRYLDK